MACKALMASSPPDAGRLANTPALSANWVFHCEIYIGWSSNCSANSAKVLSPLKAAKATFALNSGECVLLGLLITLHRWISPS